jgi:hypothetical protein
MVADTVALKKEHDPLALVAPYVFPANRYLDIRPSIIHGQAIVKIILNRKSQKDIGQGSSSLADFEDSGHSSVLPIIVRCLSKHASHDALFFVVDYIDGSRSEMSVLLG